MMKKRILAIMACGILVTTTAGFGTAEIAEAANVTELSYGSDIDERGREYVDEFDPETNQVIDFYEVEFQIPESWTKVDSSSGLVYNSDSDNGTLSISGGRAGQSYDMTMEEVQDEAIASVDGGDSFVETGREVVTILDDMPALYFTCTQILSGIPLDICALAFSTDDYIYIFSYADRQDSGYNHSQEFDEIINSISLAPETDTVTYYEVSFWVPETWVNISTDEEEVMFMTDNGAMLVNSEEGSFGTDLMGIEENQDVFISAYEDEDSYELTDRQTITVLDDIPALYFKFSFLMDGEPMNYVSTMFSTDERLYLFAHEEYITGDSQMDYFDEIIDSISWATDGDAALSSNDFFSDEERQEQYKELYESYQMTALYDYVNEYISEMGDDIAPNDSAYTILELVEPLVEFEDTWTVKQDEFDSSYSVTFPGADTISDSESISLEVKGSSVKVTVGFQKSGWLFFDKFGLSIDGEAVESHTIKSYDRNEDVIGSGTIEETYVANSLFKDPSGQLKDAEKAIIRFESTDSDEIYDHTLTDAEMNALYVGYLLRENYVDLSNLLYRYQNNITMD